MKPWDIDREQGEFLVFKYRTIENRPFSTLIAFRQGGRTLIERRTWNGCGWEVL
jgi:hypothetical protein